MKKRLIIACLVGALLGVLCIVGIGFRLGFDGNETFLFSAWFNRLMMGLMIGLAAPIVIVKNRWNPLLRGILLGFIVSYSWYVATGNRDFVGFLAGIVYGPIIDSIATKYSK